LKKTKQVEWAWNEPFRASFRDNRTRPNWERGSLFHINWHQQWKPWQESKTCR
jgi:hypothetical protein